MLRRDASRRNGRVTRCGRRRCRARTTPARGVPHRRGPQRAEVRHAPHVIRRSMIVPSSALMDSSLSRWCRSSPMISMLAGLPVCAPSADGERVDSGGEDGISALPWRSSRRFIATMPEKGNSPHPVLFHVSRTRKTDLADVGECVGATTRVSPYCRANTRLSLLGLLRTHTFALTRAMAVSCTMSTIILPEVVP